MNVHHLELFYYVALHGGISEAVRQMPYGIQQPAVSAQVLQLEEYLGLTLFQRRPFRLTSPGEKLFKFIEPFFGGLDRVTRELQGDTVRRLRVGASQTVLRDYLPEVIRKLRDQHPGLRVTLREGYETDLEHCLERQEIDFALTTIGGKPPVGIKSRPLLELPLMLLVPGNSRLRSAESLWKCDRVEEPLVCMPPGEAICKIFQHGLEKKGVDWLPAIEVSSLALIETYVANGFGIGLTVAIPGRRPPPETRGISLPDFPPVVVGVLWRGRPSPLMQTVFDEIELRARELVRR